MTLKRTAMPRTLPTERKVRTKKCKVASCRKEFTPRLPLQICCGIACALDHAIAERVRKERSERQAGLAKLKRRADHLKEAQTALNAWIRARDATLPCISCDRPATWQGQWHASHYRSVGSSPGTRFNEANIHKACSICNNHLSGNIREYRPRLIAKIGAEAVEALECDNEPRKWSVDEIIAIKLIYKARLRALTKGE